MGLVTCEGITAPEVFWVLTAHQITDISNGCGPKGWGWLIPDRFRFLGYNIRVACDIHDYMYQVWYPKKDADNVFLSNCQQLAQRAHPGCRTFAGWLAFQYYLAVKNLGAGAYNRAGATK